MGYDDVIPLLGGFGRYQRRIYFLLCLPGICCAFHLLSNVFIQATPNFWCRLPNKLFNTSYDLRSGAFNTSHVISGGCTILQDDGLILPCENYVFDHSMYKSTTVTEWNLVCNQSYIKTIGDSMLMFGVMVGAIIFGDLSDRYGRKPIFFITLVVQVAFSILTAFAPNYWIFTICRTIVGGTASGYLVSYVITMEMVGPKDRILAGTICQMFFSLGYMLTGGFAYLINEWRYLQVTLSLPGILFLSYWWLIPESVRWLISKDRLKDAVRLIQICADENKIEIPTSQIETLLVGDSEQKNTSDKKQTILEVFKYPNLRKYSLIMFLNWFVTSSTYYGLSWNTSNLGGSDYVNFAISGAVEIPGYLFVLLTLNKWGRKPVLCGCMVTTGIALLLTLVMQKEPVWISIVLVMIGKFSITAGTGIVYIFATEQFPTVIRNAGLGVCCLSGRIGSTIAPSINLLNSIWRPLPMVIFGTMAIISAILSWQLPETLNQELPETLGDCDMLFGNSVNLKNSYQNKEPLPATLNIERIEESKQGY